VKKLGGGPFGFRVRFFLPLVVRMTLAEKKQARL
jgi:hypothetical protein